MAMTDEERRQRYQEILRKAEATLRRREAEHRRGKQERRALRKAPGGPCQAITKAGNPCRRRAMANQVCMTHGGMDVMTLWRAMKGQ
jgi:hypothetical protein